MTLDHSEIDELLAARALDGLDPGEAARLERLMDDHDDCTTCRDLEAEHRETAAMLAYAVDPRPMHPAVVERIVGTTRHEVVSAPERRERRWQIAFGVAAGVAAALAVVLVAGPDQAPTDRFLRFEGGSGELAAAYAPGREGIVVFGSGLPDPGAGKVYELWLIRDGVPTSGACLTPRDGSVGTFVSADVRDAELLAITVEAASCPEAPTTDPVYTATVS